MIAWLNENIGTDAATYIGLILGFMGLFGGAKFFNLTSNRKVNKFDGGKINEQTLNVGSGNGFQAGGDMNINIGTINSAAQEKVDEKSYMTFVSLKKLSSYFLMKAQFTT